MKLKVLLCVLVGYLFFSCTDSKVKDMTDSAESNKADSTESNKLSGVYTLTDKELNAEIGYMIFAENEIAVFKSDGENNLGLQSVWKYYIKGKSLYTCICNSRDCLDKNDETAFGNYWDIESINQNDRRQTVILQNTINKNNVYILVKTKAEGLDVKEWDN